MPRTTAFIVIGLGAVIVGYFVLAHFEKKSSTSQTAAQGKGGGGGGNWYGSGAAPQVTVIREWQRGGGRGKVNPGGPEK